MYVRQRVLHILEDTAQPQLYLKNYQFLYFEVTYIECKILRKAT